MLQPVLAVDFDGCLCVNAWPEVGAPLWPVIEAAKQRQREGWALVLWTCREGDALAAAVEACSGWGLSFDAVNASLPSWVEAFGNDSRKVGATEYWDDKAVCVPAYQMPEDGQPVKLSFVSLSPLGDKTVTSCEGDLILFCNVLDDYARLLDTYMEMTPELSAIASSRYAYYSKRFRERSDRMAARIGYDKAEAAARCAKVKAKEAKGGGADDVGEEALVLALKRSKAKEG